MIDYAKNLSLVIDIFVLIIQLILTFEKYDWNIFRTNLILFVIRLLSDILCFISIPSGGAFDKIDDSDYILYHIFNITSVILGISIIIYPIYKFLKNKNQNSLKGEK